MYDYDLIVFMFTIVIMTIDMFMTTIMILLIIMTLTGVMIMIMIMPMAMPVIMITIMTMPITILINMIVMMSLRILLPVPAGLSSEFRQTACRHQGTAFLVRRKAGKRPGAVFADTGKAPVSKVS